MALSFQLGDLFFDKVFLCVGDKGVDDLVAATCRLLGSFSLETLVIDQFILRLHRHRAHVGLADLLYLAFLLV